MCSALAILCYFWRHFSSLNQQTLSGGELGTSYFLPRIVGRGRAAQALLTGKEISTDQAEQWGLLNEAGLRDVQSLQE